MNDDQQTLKNFMVGYFHEDWALDADSLREVVGHYFQDQDSAEEFSSIDRAQRGLIEGDDDDEAWSRRWFGEFGSYFDPRGAGLSTRAWLQMLADEFEREIEARG